MENRAFTDSFCGDGLTCQTPASFGGSATCYDMAQDESKCKCTTPNSFNSDPHSNSSFIFCPLADSDPMVHRCPGKMTFDDVIMDCTNADGIPGCSKGGVFANTNNCAQYYTCIQAVDGWVQNVLQCDEGKMYNQAKKECSDPCTWPDPNFECIAEGRFADPKSCFNYFVCVADPTSEIGFKQTSRKCPLDYEWDPTANNDQGHCAVKGSSKCTPVTDNVCIIPDSYKCEGSSGPGSADGTPDTDVEEILSPVSGTVISTTPGTDAENAAAENAAAVEPITTPAGIGARFAFHSPNTIDVEAKTIDSVENVLQLLKNTVQ